MTNVFISGLGAVSPAGWSVANLRQAVEGKNPFSAQELHRPGRDTPLPVLRVPPPPSRPPFLAHPRLRRSSPISQFALAAVLEALGPRADDPAFRANTAVIACVFSGCVNYSRRFYDETLKDPATASPLLFPETVFNAPASHISAFLGASAINYTLVGDAGTILTGLALAAHWLLSGQATHCILVGAEEIDWLTADALHLFDRSKNLSEGAGALLLTLDPAGALARLTAVTDEFLYPRHGKMNALAKMRAQLESTGPATLLCDSTSSARGISKQESSLWHDWTAARLSPRKILGEGLMAAAAWQLVLAAASRQTARVSIAGFHQHAIGARLES